MLELEKQPLSKLTDARLVKADDYAYDAETVTNRIAANMTEDRVFGIMSHATLNDFYPEYEVRKLQKELAEEKKRTVFMVQVQRLYSRSQIFYVMPI